MESGSRLILRIYSHYTSLRLGSKFDALFKREKKKEKDIHSLLRLTDEVCFRCDTFLLSEVTI